MNRPSRVRPHLPQHRADRGAQRGRLGQAEVGGGQRHIGQRRLGGLHLQADAEGAVGDGVEGAAGDLHRPAVDGQHQPAAQGHGCGGRLRR